MYVPFWLRHNPWSRPSSERHCPTLAKFRPVVLIISSRQLISVPRTINSACPFCSNCAAAHQPGWACSRQPRALRAHGLSPAAVHIHLTSQPSNLLLSGESTWRGRGGSIYLSIQHIQMCIPCPWKFMRPVLCYITSGPNLVLECACTSPSALDKEPHMLSKRWM